MNEPSHKNLEDNIDTPKDPDEFFVQAVLLSEVVKRVLDIKANMFLSRVENFELRPIVEFRRRMRVSGYEKFETATYLSTVNFFKSQADLDNDKALGALVLYFDEEFVPDLIRNLDYPEVDIDNQSEMEDACGTICNLIAANFKTGLVQLGYQELFMSHFSSFRSEVLNGVAYDPREKEKYEIKFEIRNKKKLVADLTMGKIPKDYQS